MNYHQVTITGYDHHRTWSENWMLKLNIGENQYYTTTNDVTKTIDTHDKQNDLGVTFDSKLIFDKQ